MGFVQASTPSCGRNTDATPTDFLLLNTHPQDTNQWGQDRRDGRNLAHLLRELSEIEGLRWVRLLYCYPSYFSDELVGGHAPRSGKPPETTDPVQTALTALCRMPLSRAPPPPPHTHTD